MADDELQAIRAARMAQMRQQQQQQRGDPSQVGNIILLCFSGVATVYFFF